MGIKVVKALKRNNEGVAHSAIDTLNALIQPMHDNYDLRQEQLNKVTQWVKMIPWHVIGND